MTATITAQRAQEFGILPQAEDESEYAFRERVSGELRAQGHIIEAHEAFRNALYDQDDNAMSGIVGAVAQALHGVNYSGDGVHQVGDDIAAGMYMQQERDDDPMLAMLAMALFGGGR